MAENSKIEWTDHTFNPWIGCTKVSPGCVNCYAEVSTPTRVARKQGRELWGKGQARQRTSEANWKEPMKWNRYETCSCESGDVLIGGICNYCGERTRRPRVFCASLSDWLDDEVPIEWLADLLKLIHDTPHLDWLLLSKRPENWAKRISVLSQFREVGSAQFLWELKWYVQGIAPENVWIGTTVEDQARADQRIPELLKIPARVRFLSVEPMLESVDLTMALEDFQPINTDLSRKPAPIQWVICGGESGPKKRPFNPDWARSIKAQCEEAKTAFFMKQIDKVQPIPDDLIIREFPV